MDFNYKAHYKKLVSDLTNIIAISLGEIPEEDLESYREENKSSSEPDFYTKHTSKKNFPNQS